MLETANTVDPGLGEEPFSDTFLFQVLSPGWERAEDTAHACPCAAGCMSCPSLPLSPYTVLLSLSPDTWFSRCFLLAEGEDVPLSSSHLFHLCSLCGWTGIVVPRWGTQHFYWADFPSGSPCLGWSQHTGALMPALERGRMQGTLQNAKENISDGLFVQLLQTCILQFSPTLLTSLLPCTGHSCSRWGYPGPGWASREC